MKRTNKELDSIIESAAAEIRSEHAGPSESQKAAERVWMKLSSNAPSSKAPARPVDQIRGCQDFQALMPAYLDGTLSSARVLLLEDHTHECIPCRKALKAARQGEPIISVPAIGSTTSASAPPTWKWAMAAAVILALGVMAYIWYDRSINSLQILHAVVYAEDGPVYAIGDNGARPLETGDLIKAGEKIRAGRNAQATVKLPDGTLVEMSGRSQLSVTNALEGMTVHLDRGDIIVQAAKQHSKHLFVATDDCTVSVVGTVFAVNSGTKGSRVAVAQGQVHVDTQGKDQVLNPGDEVSTGTALETVPVKNEFSWSHNAQQYLELLADLGQLKNEVNDKVSTPPLRYSSALLDGMPSGTVLYVALPNLSGTIAESNQIIEERINQNPALKQWWDSNRSSTGRAQFDEVIRKVAGFGQYLGDEIVASAEMSAQGGPDNVMVTSTLTNPAEFRSYLDQQVQELSASSSNRLTVKVVDDPASFEAPDQGTPTATAAGTTIYTWINGNTIAAAPELQSLRHYESAASSGTANPFKQSSFYSDIAAAYQNGAGLVVAADLENILKGVMSQNTSSTASSETAAFNRLGLFSLKHFTLESSAANGKTVGSAVLSFNEPRQGISSWLAAPGPMGSLQFISPDASLVAAFVVNNPSGLVEDLTSAIGTIDPGFTTELNSLEAKSGVNLMQDLAAPLGGEYAFAIDGPLLPSPSWKMIVEVYDQQHLQQTLTTIVTELNQWSATQGKQGFQLVPSTASGQQYYTLKSLDTGLDISYTYTNGYLIAAGSQALVERALQYQATEYNLPHSQQFISALPDDHNANFSAMLYHNLGASVGSLASAVQGSIKALSPEKQQVLKSMASAKPSIAYAYAEGDRILFSTTSDGDLFGLGTGTLLGSPNAFELQNVISHAAGGN
ncbi:MAG TPA: FecR domain-containing protein [Blastocatellia bacterium]